MVYEQRLHRVNYAYANSLQCHTQWFLKWFQYKNWAAAWQNQQNDMCVQRRLRTAWASAQSDQSMHCPPEAKLVPKLPIERTAKTLIRLGGRRLWSDWADAQADLSLRWAQSSFCWFSHETARNVSSLSLNTQHIHISSHFFFTFRMEPNTKSFSHANNIVLRRDIYIHCLNWC